METRLTEKEQRARKMVCLPLDGLDTRADMESRVEELSAVVGLFKIGKEAFTDFGPDSIKMVKDHGSEVFLDLKYHDIPATVRGAARAATKHGVYMFNVHASGGTEMMKAAVEGAWDGTGRYGIETPKIVGVSVLTSLDKDKMNNELRVPGKVEDQVAHLAKMSYDSGLDGIVCSAADLSEIRGGFQDDFFYVTPGVKGPNVPAGADQKRVCTPYNAVRWGSNILVVGRAITAGKTPDERLQNGYEVLQDMAKAF